MSHASYQDALWSAARAAIGVMEDERGGARPGPDAGGAHTLEGAVARAISGCLAESFEDRLRREIQAANQEEAGLRLGHLDLRDLADYDAETHEFAAAGPTRPRSRADELIEQMRGAIDSLERLSSHACSFDPETDYCTLCGADGRA